VEAVNDNRAKEWDVKVDGILKKINRQANVYFSLGMLLYGGGSILLMVLLQDKPMLLTLVVMFFFQLCVMFFGTKVIFPCISGAFRVGLLANRESMPIFEKLGEVAADPEKSPVVQRLERAALDIRDEGAKIRSELTRMADAFTKPIAPPPPRVRVPMGVAHGGKEGNCTID
jgi:hypothetical protein